MNSATVTRLAKLVNNVRPAMESMLTTSSSNHRDFYGRVDGRVRLAFTNQTFTIPASAIETVAHDNAIASLPEYTDGGDWLVKHDY